MDRDRLTRGRFSENGPWTFCDRGHGEGCTCAMAQMRPLAGGLGEEIMQPAATGGCYWPIGDSDGS